MRVLRGARPSWLPRVSDRGGQDGRAPRRTERPMELRQLETFRAVAGPLSFTRAAVTLGYAQSSVTAQIQALEAELGVALFDRLGRRVALTEAGQRLLEYADRLLSLADEARAAVAEGAEPAGTLTVGAPETVLTYRLPRVLQRYRATFP